MEKQLRLPLNTTATLELLFKKKISSLNFTKLKRCFSKDAAP